MEGVEYWLKDGVWQHLVDNVLFCQISSAKAAHNGFVMEVKLEKNWQNCDFPKETKQT